MTTLRADRVGRFCAVAAGITTCVVIVLTLTCAVPQRWPLVVVLVGALSWGLGGVLAVVLIPTSRRGTGPNVETRVVDRGRRLRNAPATDPKTGSQQMDETRVGTLMYLGSVPDQVARLTSAIAAGHGPVVLVVPIGRSVPIGLDPAVLVAGSLDNVAGHTEAVMAEFYDRCDAVLVVSARAMPTSGCHDAVQRMSGGASWVQGTVEPLNRDRFGPTERETLDARLRRLATTTGLWCWEPDATIVSTSLLRSNPLPTGRPMGSWLRDRAADGETGVVVTTALSRRAAPVAADAYWPDTTARQCALAADLSDAARSGSATVRARAVAAGLLIRSLSGWSLMWWLAALVLLPDGSPVRHGGRMLAVLVIVSAGLRWLAPRLRTGAPLSPIADLIAGLYSLPGSLLAIRPALTRRVHAPRRGMSTRPLVWLALLATAAAASVVLTAGSTATATRVATGAAVGLLVLTWVFAVRSIVERSWNRVGFRVPLDLAATVIVDTTGTNRHSQAREQASRIVDGGPGGFAVIGPRTGHVVGDEVAVRMSVGSGERVTLHGTVAGIRDNGDEAELMGVELRRVEPDPVAWARVLSDSASSAPHPDEAPITPAELDGGHLIDRLAIGLVVITSVVVVFTIGLLMIGLRPLVIRSGSMEPTYGIGDVVLVSSEPAANIREGQVVTRFGAPEAVDSLTHRVRHVTRDRDEVQVETRGDANDSSEFWSMPPEQHVGVLVASIPGIGRPLTSVRSSVGWAVTAMLLVLTIVGLLFRPRRAADGPRTDKSGRSATAEGRLSEDFLSPIDELPTTSSTSTSGERK